MNQKCLINILLVVLVVIIVGGVGYLVVNQNNLPSTQTPVLIPESKTDVTMGVSLGQQFNLREKQSIKIGNTGLEIGIIKFYNSPCPKDARCIWSGVGIGFEYRFNGEVKNGIDLVEAFGYRTTIVKTDHETYADLVVEKMK